MVLYLRTFIDNLLRLPELRDLKDTDFDSREASIIQREIFKRKKILKILYQEYCSPFVKSAKRAPKGAKMVEIGSGSSQLREAIPNLICTDLINITWLDLTCSAYALPFKDNSLDRIFLMFVCHHLGKIVEFLNEAYRCLKPNGEMVIIDPAITLFSRFYYKYCHVDKMDIHSKEWGFEGSGRLSDSNIALTWIIFLRDNGRFNKLYPEFIIEREEYSTCLTFLLSGGLRIRQLLPTFLLKVLFSIENWIIRHVTRQLAVTMALTIRKC